MSLELSGLVNNNYQNNIYQQARATSKRNGIDFSGVLATKKTENTVNSQNITDAGTSNINAYTEYLKSKYGNVMVQDVGKDQKSMDNIGAGTAGTGNVVIAPNILEQMANDPEKAAYYEKKIQDYFNRSLPQTVAFMAAIGHNITSSGVVIHADGTVTYYLSGEESPEQKAKVEAEQKAKREKKAEQRKENIEHSQEAAEKQKQLVERYNKEHIMAETLNDHIWDMNKIAVSNVPQYIESAVATYENAVNTFSANVLANGD